MWGLNLYLRHKSRPHSALMRSFPIPFPLALVILLTLQVFLLALQTQHLLLPQLPTVAVGDLPGLLVAFPGGGLLALLGLGYHKAKHQGGGGEYLDLHDLRVSDHDVALVSAPGH